MQSVEIKGIFERKVAHADISRTVPAVFSGSPRSDLGGDPAFVEIVIAVVTVHSESAAGFSADVLFPFPVVIAVAPAAD